MISVSTLLFVWCEYFTQQVRDIESAFAGGLERIRAFKVAWSGASVLQ